MMLNSLGLAEAPIASSPSSSRPPIRPPRRFAAPRRVTRRSVGCFDHFWPFLLAVSWSHSKWSRCFFFFFFWRDAWHPAGTDCWPGRVREVETLWRWLTTRQGEMQCTYLSGKLLSNERKHPGWYCRNIPWNLGISRGRCFQKLLIDEAFLSGAHGAGCVHQRLPACVPRGWDKVFLLPLSPMVRRF